MLLKLPGLLMRQLASAGGIRGLPPQQLWARSYMTHLNLSLVAARLRHWLNRLLMPRQVRYGNLSHVGFVRLGTSYQIVLHWRP